MSSVELTCPKCGEKIQFDSDKKKEADKVFCSYCGNGMTAMEAMQIAVDETQKIIDNMQAKKASASNVDSELENLYTLARRAKDTNNSENAQKYYDMILPKDPNNWEPNFFSVYYQAMSCKIAGIASAASNVKNNLLVVGEMIATKFGNDKSTVNIELEQVVCEVSNKLAEITQMFHNASYQHFRECMNTTINYAPEYVDICAQCTQVMYFWANVIETYWGDNYGKYIAFSYSTGIEYHKNLAKKLLNQNDFAKEKQMILSKAAIVQKYNPNYKVGYFKKDDNNPNDGGCYIATAVYGSYDCPEVWTLRRFRDYTLYESWYGRAFIKAYYATSPTLVKWFGKTRWFKKSWSAVLDRFVAKLNNDGVANTPYNDRQF